VSSEQPVEGEAAVNDEQKVPPKASRRRRWMVGSLIAAASLVLVLSVLALWIRRVVLDSEGYNATTSQLLQQPEIQQALATNLVDQLYANVDIATQVQPLLPKQAQPLAAPAAAALRDYAYTAAARLLASDRAQQAWIRANELAHAQLVLVLDGGGSRLKTGGGEVSINTSGLEQNLAGRLGLSPTTSIAGGKIVIFTSNQLSLVQTLAHWLKVLAWVLPFVSLALYALAVYLATGYRRRAVRNCGISIIAAGVILVIARTVGGNLLVDHLVKLPANRPAANAAWDVLTGLLKDTTRTVIAVGFISVIWAWVSGEGERPVSIRRAFAPHARDHAGQVWVVFTAVVLFLIWWAPTQAFRRPVPALVMIVLAGVGLEAVRRQSVKEFPYAESGGVSTAVRDKLSRPQPAAPAAVAPVDQLERLSALHDQGALSDQEFQAMKSSLLP
jgi:Short C-terminal domain